MDGIGGVKPGWMLRRCALTLFLAAVPALAVPPTPSFRQGDVVTVTDGFIGCAIDPPPPITYATWLHDRAGRPQTKLTDAVITAETYSDAMQGIFVARSTGPSRQSIDFLGADGTFVPLTRDGLPADITVRVLTPLGSGFWGIVYTGSGGHQELWQFDGSGTVIDRILIPTREYFIGSIDLAADRCTFFYTTGSSIARYDVCLHRPLPDLVESRASAIRVLPDGSLLAAEGATLVRYDANGSVVAQFRALSDPSQEAIASMTLDHDPSIVWLITDHGCFSGQASVLSVSLTSRALLAGPVSLASNNGLFIAVQGEWHAAVNPAPPAAHRRRAVR